MRLCLVFPAAASSEVVALQPSLLEDAEQRSNRQVLFVHRHYDAAASFGMIINVMAALCAIQDEALLFQQTRHLTG